MGLLASALVFALGVAPGMAAAVPILEIVFLESGTSVIEAGPGEIVTAEIRLTADAAGISSYGVSVAFDEELDLVDTTELLPAGFTFNLSVGVEGSNESEPGTTGQVLTFESGTFGVGPVNATFAIGRIRFEVVAALDDGNDLAAFPFNPGIDGLFDNESVALVEFGPGSASVVPEPGTLGLLLVGMTALAASRRRRAS
jgi:hypothetical protein